MKNTKLILNIGFVFIMSLALYSCKKDSVINLTTKPDRVQPVETGAALKENLLKDSVYYYTDYFYLWQDQLPAWGSFNPAIYSKAEDVLEALTKYAKDPDGKLLDRFSFIDRTGDVSESIEQGLSGSFGFDLRYNNEVDLFVKLVYPESAADLAGLERGWQILEINGNNKVDLASFEADDFAFLNNALDNSPSITLKLIKNDGVETTAQFSRSSFRMKPVLYQEVLDLGSKKVGYFVFDSFITTETLAGSPTYVKNDLDQMFANFESEGISELIIDLRYNGGGAVVTAEYLSNLLAPLVANGQLMYDYGINSELEADGWRNDFFTPVNFNKTNALNLTKLYFLVTKGSTASASELVINNLKPFIPIKLIGEKSTYGKPVGFFGWPIFDVDLYAVSFKLTNSQGYGDYFDGMPVDVNANDDVSKNWGDPDESMFKQALYHIQNGSFMAISRSMQAGARSELNKERNSRLNNGLDKRGNRDMFMFKKSSPMPIR